MREGSKAVCSVSVLGAKWVVSDYLWRKMICGALIVVLVEMWERERRETKESESLLFDFLLIHSVLFLLF